MLDLSHRIQRRVGTLPPLLQAHIHRVRNIAADLAERHGLDKEQTSLAVLAHDIARAMPGDELIRRAEDLGLPVSLVDRRIPVFLHGPVGAEILRREEHLDDGPVYAAARWHTTGHPSLDQLGKAVFLADKLDPQKRNRYPYSSYLHHLAMEDLDEAMLEFLNRELAARVSRSQLVHPVMVDTRNALLLSLNRAALGPE